MISGVQQEEGTDPSSIISSGPGPVKVGDEDAPAFSAGHITVLGLSFCLGLSALLPWFSFTVSAEYFRERFCGSAVEDSFLVYFSIAYNFSNLIMLVVLMSFYKILLPYGRVRILGSLLLLLVCGIITTVCVAVTSISATSLFVISLLSVAVCGAMAVCFMGGVLAVLGTFPEHATQAFISGQGLAGCVVSVVSFSTIAIGSEKDSFCDGDEESSGDECSHNLDFSALAFFTALCFVLAAAVACYSVLENLPLTKYYEHKAILDRANSIIDPPDVGTLESPLLPDDSQDEGEVQKKKVSKYIRVGKAIKVPALTVFITFTITLSMYPAVTVLIEAQDKCDSGASRFSNDLFIPLMFFIFNGCDFIGRISAQKLQSFITAKNMWIAALARLAFYPLIMLCNIDGTQLPVVFTKDVYTVLIMCAFGFTNGSLVSLACMTAPSMVPPRHSSIAATLMLFFLTAGLCAGASLSFVVLLISQGNW